MVVQQMKDKPPICWSPAFFAASTLATSALSSACEGAQSPDTDTGGAEVSSWEVIGMDRSSATLSVIGVGCLHSAVAAGSVTGFECSTCSPPGRGSEGASMETASVGWESDDAIQTKSSET